MALLGEFKYPQDSPKGEPCSQSETSRVSKFFCDDVRLFAIKLGQEGVAENFYFISYANNISIFRYNS
jgi:hypothetical protein